MKAELMGIPTALFEHISWEDDIVFPAIAHINSLFPSPVFRPWKQAAAPSRQPALRVPAYTVLGVVAATLSARCRQAQAAWRAWPTHAFVHIHLSRL